MLALVAAGYVLRSDLERRTGRGDAALALTVAAGVGGLVGARAYWLLEHLGGPSPTDSFSAAGFTWYGGVIGGAAAMLAVARVKQVGVVPLLGASAPALALGYAVGRVACQLAGDGTYGRASDLPWAMSYPHGEVPTTQRVQPTPVYAHQPDHLRGAVAASHPPLGGPAVCALSPTRRARALPRGVRPTKRPGAGRPDATPALCGRDGPRGPRAARPASAAQARRARVDSRGRGGLSVRNALQAITIVRSRRSEGSGMGRRAWRRRPYSVRLEEEQALAAEARGQGARPLVERGALSLGVIGLAVALGVVSGCGGGVQAGARAADTADSAPFGEH